MTDVLTRTGTGIVPDGMIVVENPATGEEIAVVENMSAAQVEALVARARAAQPGWAALGFARARTADVRAAPLARQQPRARDRHDRRRERQDARGRAARGALLHGRLARLLGQARGEVPRRREGAHALAVRARQEGRRAPPAARRGRRDRAVELPADARRRRRAAGADGRQRGRDQAERGHAARDRRCSSRPRARRLPRGRVPGRHRRRVDRRGARRLRPTWSCSPASTRTGTQGRRAPAASA